MSTQLIIAAIYTLVIVALGLFLSRRTKTNDADYYLADRSTSGWVGALSASASSESAWVLMGLVGAAYVSGASVFWLIPGCLVGYAFNWWIIAPRIRRASLEHSTTNVSDTIAKEVKSPRMGLLLSAIIIVFLIVYLSAQFLAVGKALAAMSDLPQLWGVIVSAVLVAMYTSAGGMRASLVTDVLQSIMMVVALILIPLVAFFSIDPSATSDIPKNYFDTFGGAVGFGTIGLILGWAGIGLAYPGQPQVLQRFMTLRNDDEVRAGRWIALLWSALVFTGAICAGMIGRHVIAPTDNELVLIELAKTFTHPIIGGMVIAAIFAAIASTADSQLITISSHIKSEWLHLIGLNEVNPKFITFVIAVSAAFIAAFNNSTIFSLVLYAWEFLGVTIGIAVLGTFVFNLTARHSLFALSASAITLMVWRNIPMLNDAVYSLVPAFSVGLLLLFILFFTGSSSTKEQGNP